MKTRVSPAALVVMSLLGAGCYFHDRDHGSSGGLGGLGLLGADAGCDSSADPDPCAAAGLACTPMLPSNTFSCQLPGEFFQCDPAVGCAGGLQCTSGNCLQACTTTADCGDPLTVCGMLQDGGPTFCLLDQCGSPDGGGFWEPCDDAGGTCVVLGEFTFTLVGACLQGGSVASGGTCQYFRAADAGLCAPGLVCTVDAAGDNSGLCLPVCDPFFDGGPNCGAGTACVESAIPAAPPAISYFDYYNHSGVCAQSCVAEDGGPADAGDPGDAGVPDAGTGDGGLPDAGLQDAGGPDAGSPSPDAGTTDAGGTSGNTGCAAPTSCTNASPTSAPTFVCLP